MMTVDAHSPVGSRGASSNHGSVAGTGRFSVGGNGTVRSSLPLRCSGIGAPDGIETAAASSVREAASAVKEGKAGNDAVSPTNTTGGSRRMISNTGNASSTTASVSSVFAVKPPVLPSRPPDVVQQWLRREDWEALSIAWAAAEAQAISWEEGDLDDPFKDTFDEDFDESWPDVDFGTSQLASSQASTASPTFSSSEARPWKSRRKPWNEDFHLIGQDTRKPAPLRRYFDSVPSETSPKREPVRLGLRPKAAMIRGEDEFGPDSPAEPWNRTFGSLASTDNDGLHPHLRHYFDRRGLEATYKMRPHCDHKWLQALPPRSPDRPSTQEKLLRRSSSEPALGGSSLTRKTGDDKLDVKARGMGSIPWGTRCLLFGPSTNVNQSPLGEKIPWVYDHGVTETDDNDILNPMLRHYFDADGIESSFRNRGRHYGRPTKMCFGIPPIEHRQRSPKPASKKANHGQLPFCVDQGDVTSSPKSSAASRSKRSASLGGLGSAVAGETFTKAHVAKRLLGKKATASTSSLSVLAALEAENTGRRSVGQRIAPGGLLAVLGASPSARSTGQHGAPAVFGELPSPGGRLTERRRSSTDTKELVPSIAYAGPLASKDSGGKFAGTGTFGAGAFTAAVSPEAAACEQFAVTADFGGALSPGSRRPEP